MRRKFFASHDLVLKLFVLITQDKNIYVRYVTKIQTGLDMICQRKSIFCIHRCYGTGYLSSNIPGLNLGYGMGCIN
jgi:hypothetical protein